jgi:hypothetical protein
VALHAPDQTSLKRACLLAPPAAHPSIKLEAQPDSCVERLAACGKRHEEIESARLAAPAQGFSMPSQQLKEEFVAANPRLKAEYLAVGCGNNYLTGVSVCLTKQLEPTACQALRDCRANSIKITPVP